MFQVSTPQSSEDWQAYYQLRWQVLRAPWGEPRGSEQDDMEQDSEHRFIKNKEGEVLAYCTSLKKLHGFKTQASLYCLHANERLNFINATVTN